MNIPSLLRREEHRVLSSIELEGRVLDLGGDARSEYLRFVTGSFTVTTVNIDPQAKPDILHDLEQSLPILDRSFDGVVLVNVLEHIFDYRKLIEESVRVLVPGGKIVIVVPFLFPLHPSPQDYHRFSAATLIRELERAGVSVMQTDFLGGGVFSARYLLLDRLLPRLLRLVNYYTVRFWVYIADELLTKGARLMGKTYRPSNYALGICLVGRKGV